jgi:hypothetical protein
MTGMPWTGDEAFRRELATTSKARLKLRISAGALIAIVSASHLVDGALHQTLATKNLPLFGLALGLYVVVHFSLLLWTKRELEG